MKHGASSLALALGLALLAATPAAGQAWFFPDYSLPSAGTPSTWMAGTYGRGLNDNSGKADAVGAAVGHTTERASFMGSFGYITDEDGEYTAGGALSFDLNTGEGPRLALQGGIGWMDLDLFGETLTLLRFPIGLSLRGAVASGNSTVTPWVMPRINIARVSGGGESDTQTDFGASGGLSLTTQSGFGVHTALDGLFSDGESAWLLGFGVHFVFGYRK